jgi:hypothetical protein
MANALSIACPISLILLYTYIHTLCVLEAPDHQLQISLSSQPGLNPNVILTPPLLDTVGLPLACPGMANRFYAVTSTPV